MRLRNSSYLIGLLYLVSCSPKIHTPADHGTIYHELSYIQEVPELKNRISIFGSTIKNALHDDIIFSGDQLTTDFNLRLNQRSYKKLSTIFGMDHAVIPDTITYAAQNKYRRLTTSIAEYYAENILFKKDSAYIHFLIQGPGDLMYDVIYQVIASAKYIHLVNDVFIVKEEITE